MNSHSYLTITPKLGQFAVACLIALVSLGGLAGCTPPAPAHGTEYLLAVDPAEAPGTTDANPDAALQRTGKALTRRLDLFGSHATFETVKPNLLRIRVGDPASGSVTNLGKLLTRAGRLEFRPVHPDSEKLLETGTLPPGYELMKEVISRPGGTIQRRPFVVAKDSVPGLTGHVKRAFPDKDANSDQVLINFEFDAEGARAFGEVTAQNVGRQLAIVLDGVLYSAPVIRSPITGGAAVISGSFTMQEARELAATLESAVDLRIRVVEERKWV